jgi:hypothetical protein
MFLEGNLGLDEDGDFPCQQMSLELRLNVSAFYERCFGYPFTSPTLTKWEVLVVQEYDYLVNNNSLAQISMSYFNPLPSFPNDRLAWSANFNLLDLPLTSTDTSTSFNFFLPNKIPLSSLPQCMVVFTSPQRNYRGLSLLSPPCPFTAKVPLYRISPYPSLWFLFLHWRCQS